MVQTYHGLFSRFVWTFTATCTLQTRRKANLLSLIMLGMSPESSATLSADFLKVLSILDLPTRLDCTSIANEPLTNYINCSVQEVFHYITLHHTICYIMLFLNYYCCYYILYCFLSLLILDYNIHIYYIFFYYIIIYKNFDFIILCII